MELLTKLNTTENKIIDNSDDKQLFILLLEE